MKRPDRNEVLSTINELKAADQKIGAAAVEIKSRTRNIRTYYSKLCERGVEESLKSVPIEDINKSADGINIQALRAEGIETLEDVIDKTKQDLIKIQGIGEIMAGKIVAAAIDCHNLIKKNYSLKISAEDLNDVAYEAMITDVYALMKVGNIGDEIMALFEMNHLPIIENGEKANTLTRKAITWFFTDNKVQNDSFNAYNTLVQIKSTGYIEKADELKASYDEAMKGATRDEAVKAFTANTAPFFAVLEKLCGSSAVKDDEQVLGLPEEVLEQINTFELDTSLMIATLRSYQEFGAKYILNQQKTLLGDEMGLGKTMQAIAAMAHLTAKGRTHFLVVCPVSVMVNWAREIEKHSHLQVMTIYGDQREQLFEEFIEKGHVAVTTYETITRLDLEKLTSLDMLTVDEAHYVKNPEAQRTKALVKIAAVADYCLLMTGTPLENRVEEMIFLTGLLRNSVAGELKSMIAVSKAPEFRSKIAPVYLRRIREDVLTELPEKIESEEWVAMTPAELKLYTVALAKNDFMGCRKVSYNVEKDEDSAKLQRLLELCHEAKEGGRRIIIFSFYISIINRVAEALGEDCFGIITGAVPSDERQKIIDDFAESPAGSVIVSQIIAGGVGLNIQCASVVIICEPQWKPSTENQAISRCYRMGQSQSVLVYRLLSEHTVDEKVMEILKEKSMIFDSYANESEIDTLNKALVNEIMEQQRAEYGIALEADVAAEATDEAMGDESLADDPLTSESQIDDQTEETSSIMNISENKEED